MTPQDISIESYNYSLPENRIPKYPLEKREQSKLLVYKNEEITDHSFRNITNLLPKETLLVFNDSKVLPVRLHFENSNGAKIEIFCLESIIEENNTSTWKCFVGKAAKWKEKTISKQIKDKKIKAEIISREKDHFIVKFYWNNQVDSMLEVLELFGQIPIPPYLKRESEDIDLIRYQNVFAHHNGSVAAPTAGLHFTKPLLTEIKSNKMAIDFVTLHVGAGTFKPVKSKTIGGHEMHVEKMLVTLNLVENLINQIDGCKTITAVGTTTLRTLESLYWLGNILYFKPDIQDGNLKVNQWTPYNKHQTTSTTNSLKAIKKRLQSKKQISLSFSTELLILPSYKFRMIDCLVTNFHQPKSTLLLLVAAAIGEQWNNVYAHAMDNDYRFLSYGDSSLLFINEENKKRDI